MRLQLVQPGIGFGVALDECEDVLLVSRQDLLVRGRGFVLDQPTFWQPGSPRGLRQGLPQLLLDGVPIEVGRP